MAAQNNFKDFDALTVSLEDINLIEASAGTGKTYSIAVMTLRLLLEKEISIDKILMVTFTKAAVAELELRIRLFVRATYAMVANETEGDQQIKSIVDSAIKQSGKKEVQRLLKKALVNLDETQVMTIHGFCQQSLNEFAFETQQLFNAELIEDTTAILQEEVNQFWRENITILSPDILTEVVNHNVSRNAIKSLVQLHLSGKAYLYFDQDPNAEKQAALTEKVLNQKEEIIDVKKELCDYIEGHRSKLEANIKTNKNAIKWFLKYLDNPEQFLDIFLLKAHKEKRKFPKKVLPDFFKETEKYIAIEDNKVNQVDGLIQILYSQAIQKITSGIRQKKIKANLLSFDDMILQMHQAITATNSSNRLKKALQNKYKAVFIDEFQDTDHQQYEIFKNAFQDSNTTVFYIGDPKQSIYGWRKADIGTYLKARDKDVDSVYTMNTNFRSEKTLVAAFNKFFLPTDDFDTFYYQGEHSAKPGIWYQAVKANLDKNAVKGRLEIKGEAAIPITYSCHPNKKSIPQQAALCVLQLLNDTNTTIYHKTTDQQEPVSPSDIGILVRSASEAANIQNALSKHHIPSVMMSKDKVLTSQEAGELLNILEAIEESKHATVARALMTGIIGWDSDDVKQLADKNEDLILQKFRDYHNQWTNGDVYGVVMRLMVDFKVQDRLLYGDKTDNGKRVLTNLLHLLEIFREAENRQHYQPLDLIDWGKKQMTNAGSNNSSDYEQRIESDEQAVKIVTIHSSKGLEYPIVLTPYLDFNRSPHRNAKFVSFKNQEDRYVTIEQKDLNNNPKFKDLYERQQEQENRRLLYVALTRASYKCFIFRNTSQRGGKNSTLSKFIPPQEAQTGIKETEQLPANPPKKYHSPSDEDKIKPKSAKTFDLLEKHWTHMSFSSLVGHSPYQHKEEFVANQQDYDRFIFHDLRKGAHTGTFLHEIMEVLDYTQPDSWPEVIQTLRQTAFPLSNAKTFDLRIEELLHHVLDTSLNIELDAFRMTDISPSRCLKEMAFSFPVRLFEPRALEKLRDSGVAVGRPEEVEGMMTGFIDLFFKHNHKYYVLDWKSNYLGPTVEDYDEKGVEQAMNQNNYHLQYLIYTFAAQKYLKSRLGTSFSFSKDFGGVFYLFLRGMRQGKNTGIFHIRPTAAQMEIMEDILTGETAAL